MMVNSCPSLRCARAGDSTGHHRARFRFSTGQCLVGLALTSLSLTTPTHAAAPDVAANVQTQYLRLVIGSDGRVREFVDRQTGQNYSEQPPGPFASVKKSGRMFPATNIVANDGQWSVTFGDSGVEVVLQPRVKDQYLVLEVISSSGDGLEELIFLDVPLTLQGLPAEPFAACALALNLQTRVQQIPQAASRLRAICYPQFGLAGAAVAVVACPPSDMRAVLQQAVSDAPELPHSPLGGPWALDAPINRGSYLFNFDGITESSVDEWIELAQSLGMTQIDFHGGQSFRFGDCRPNPSRYPEGYASLKAVIDRLHAAGIAAGLHTYAFFIAKDCPWVTPVPDPRLASDAVFTLAEPLPADARSVRVLETTEAISATTGFFVRNSVTLRIDDELITYTGVRQEPPFAFTGCQRGANGTRVAEHRQGTKVYHLKECFGLFVPDPTSTLFTEVAARTAQAFNECGFDMVYFDALDGQDILGGSENGWHYGSKYVYEVWRRLNKPALMEMSTFHHHLWCVRSRYCAWDHPNRSHKRFIDIHCSDNDKNRRMFLPGELGWWALKNWSGPQIEPTFSDDIEYLMAKALATDTGFALMGIDPQSARSAPALPRLASIIKRYEDLRHSGQVPESIRAQLRQPGAEFTLMGDVSGSWDFIPVSYAKHRVEDGGSSSTWRVANSFSRQPLQFRLQALMAAGPYDAPENLTLAEFRAADEFPLRETRDGVSATLAPSRDQVQVSETSGCYSAQSRHPTPTAAWTRHEKRFEPPMNLSDHQALGVWIHGDGQGEILNFQLRSPEHLVGHLADHYVPIDFTGWRYFELIEPEGGRWSDYQWPYGHLYAIYRESIQHGQISSLGLWYNNLPADKKATCYLSPIKAMPLVKTKLIRPTLRVGDVEVRLPVDIESGSYLEFHSTDDCKLYGPHGELIRSVAPAGSTPVLVPGDNQIRFHCETPPGVRARAHVTIITQGKPLRAKR